MTTADPARGGAPPGRAEPPPGRGDGDAPGFWWRAVSPLGALFAAFVGAGLVILALDPAPLGEDGRLTLAQVASSLLILAFGALLLRGLPDLDRRRGLTSKGGVAGGVAAGVGVGLAMVVASVVVIAIGISLDPGLERDLEEIALEFEPVAWQTALLVLSLVVLAPLGEELLFRVLLLRALARRMRFWPAAAASSLVFAAAHPDGYLVWPRALALVVSGIALAWIYRQRGYAAAVAAHATLNGIAAVSVAVSG